MPNNPPTGLVFEIREFSLYDGPGIRTTVFFKGCPLRCRWCHNPEGLLAQRELLINTQTCTHCGKCLRTCHFKSCIVCGLCVEHCVNQCRRVCGVKYRVETLCTELLKHQDVFQMSGGGITFSGGEPLMQTDFVVALANRLHEQNIHLALETSGYASLEDYMRAVESVDLVFQDLKHTNPKEHLRCTGRDNAPILENLAWLKTSKKPFVARIPLIPYTNMDRVTLDDFASLLKDAPNLLRVELMPYHATAGAKYHLTGRTFRPGFDDSNLNRQQLFSDACLAPFIAQGLTCRFV
ncbi:MAG: glycyl-radical enzyme activating protein [Thermoguttaceae bacterium]|nr:glycyl-radical enzyme activating protein [Thermoguttaceae bacterium]